MDLNDPSSLPFSRSVLSCGIVNANNGTGKEIVAAGGTDIGNARDYVEIYNIDGNVWRIANPLPQTLLGAATVQYQVRKVYFNFTTKCRYCDKIIDSTVATICTIF